MTLLLELQLLIQKDPTLFTIGAVLTAWFFTYLAIRKTKNILRKSIQKYESNFGPY